MQGNYGYGYGQCCCGGYEYGGYGGQAEGYTRVNNTVEAMVAAAIRTPGTAVMVRPPMRTSPPRRHSAVPAAVRSVPATVLSAL